MTLTKFKFIKVRLDRADMTISQTITAKEGAANGNGIELQLVNGSIIEDTTGVAVYLNWKHQSVGNQGSEPFTAVDATNGIYRITYPTELLNAGLVDADIKIVDGASITMTTQPILIKVAKGATDITVQSANAWNDIQTLLVAKIAHEARMDAIESNADTKAPLASPALTGTPTAPTAAAGTNTTQIATTAFVKGEVAALVDSSPTTLDTLNELAAALGDDPNFATTMATELGLRAPKESPALTGTPTAPTAPVDSDNTLIANTAFVKDQIANDVPDLLVRLKNWIINGMFDIWQRGLAQIATSGYGSDDRWINSHVGSTKNHSRQAFTLGQTDVPNNPTYFSRTVVSSIAGAGNFVRKVQAIEDVTKLAGKTITISFWAKADSNKNISVEFLQNFGSTGVNAIGVQKFALTTTWQRFTKTLTLPSISGKTIDGPTNTSLSFWFDAGSDFNARTDSLGNQSGTFDIANVSLVEGSVPVECQNLPYADVLRECELYFRTSYVNKANSLSDGAIRTIATTPWYPSQHAIPLTPRMRANGTVTFYSDYDGAAGFVAQYNAATGVFEANKAVHPGSTSSTATSIPIALNGTASTGAFIRFQYEVSAEL